jgi:hypothetical protein
LIESSRFRDFKLHSVLIAQLPQGLHVPDSASSESEIRPLDDPSYAELPDKYPLKKLPRSLLQKLVGCRKEIDAVDLKLHKKLPATVVPSQWLRNHLRSEEFQRGRVETKDHRRDLKSLAHASELFDQRSMSQVDAIEVANRKDTTRDR